MIGSASLVNRTWSVLANSALAWHSHFTCPLSVYKNSYASCPHTTFWPELWAKLYLTNLLGNPGFEDAHMKTYRLQSAKPLPFPGFRLALHKAWRLWLGGEEAAGTAT